SAVMCAAWKVDRGLDIKLDAAVVKYLGPELAFQAVDKALQLHGGSGNMTEYFIEKLFRDIRVWRVFEGTSEVQELTIASELLSFLKP
ncbi:MAG: acyl-CoA dehydrogenase family protein, partial [Candidatus Liptonbacteria bacterium]|nr:acyl-CoA dehydrogenase family protein [Candidatus Liptonbacteria bacterium]